MIKTIINLSILLLIIIGNLEAQAPENPNENVLQIEGQITDIHILGNVAEQVLICQFDPKFVVAIETADGMQRLAIHSPARSFEDEKPIGNSYRFTVVKNENFCKLKKIEKINP